MEKLREIQTQNSAIFDPSRSYPLSFGNDDRGLILAKEEVVICDRSHWGIFKITGDDRLRYLHNQSTNDFNILKPSEGCQTVFVTSTARTIDLATTYITEEEVIVIISPDCREQLLKWLDKFIFPFDKVELEDISSKTALFTLIGNQSEDLLKKLDINKLDRSIEYSHQLITIKDIPVRIGMGSDLGLPGYNLIVPLDNCEIIWSELINNGVIPIGDRVWEQLRILQGRPSPGKELTEDYNPLESGLWQTISFEKGCYIGQETIARLNTYKGVKQKLWGIKLEGDINPGTPLIKDDKKVGVVTSVTKTPDGIFGLAYLRSIVGGEGLSVQVGDTKGKIITVPFLNHLQ